MGWRGINCQVRMKLAGNVAGDENPTASATYRLAAQSFATFLGLVNFMASESRVSDGSQQLPVSGFQPPLGKKPGPEGEFYPPDQNPVRFVRVIRYNFFMIDHSCADISYGVMQIQKKTRKLPKALL